MAHGPDQSADDDRRFVFALVSLVTGSRAACAMIVAAGLAFVLLTFLFYVKPIKDMMRHRFASPAAS